MQRPSFAGFFGELRGQSVEHGAQLALAEPTPAHHDARTSRRVGHIAQRIGIEQQQVGARADAHRAEFARQAKKLRRVGRRGAQRVIRRQPCRDEQPQLVVERKARHDTGDGRIRAGHHPHTCLAKACSEL